MYFNFFNKYSYSKELNKIKNIIRLNINKLDNKAVKMIEQYLKDKIIFDKLKNYLLISFYIKEDK